MHGPCIARHMAIVQYFGRVHGRPVGCELLEDRSTPVRLSTRIVRANRGTSEETVCCCQAPRPHAPPPGLRAQPLGCGCGVEHGALEARAHAHRHTAAQQVPRPRYNCKYRPCFSNQSSTYIVLLVDRVTGYRQEISRHVTSRSFQVSQETTTLPCAEQRARAGPCAGDTLPY